MYIRQEQATKMVRSSDITSFSEYRSHLREHHDRVRQSGRPLFVTTNGEPDAVVLSPQTYDDLLDRAELVESLGNLDRSMEDVKSGRGRPLKEAIREIAEELGIKLNR